MAMDYRLEISLNALLAAMSKAGYEAQDVFAGTERYVPPSAGRIDGDAAAELGDHGLLRGNELDETFEHTLRVISVAHTEYFAYVRCGEAQYGVLVAALGRAAITAVSEGDRVLLKPAGEGDLTKVLAKHLPEFPATNFRPFSASRRDAAGNDHDAVDIFNDDTGTSRDAHDLRNILVPPFHGTGYLHVARRAGGGKRVQAEQAITYVDIDAGRVGFDVTGPADNQHILAFPGDNTSLAERLTRLRRALD